MRGDVFALPARTGRRGHEQRGRRYAVVVQSDLLEGWSTVLIAPTSTRALSTSFRPEVLVKGARTRVLVDQLTAVDVSVLGSPAGRLTWQELRAVDEALALVLDLPGSA